VTDQPAKQQILPWFAFNVAEYLKDTMRLTTEAHGAYLLLLLDYYATGAPCPDDDFVLAAVAKLSPEAWARHRKVLEPYFDVRDGLWYHNRVEREMLEAMLKHSSTIARAQAGGQARWANKNKDAVKPAKSPAKPRRLATSTTQAMPEAMPEAQPEQCLGDAHLHLHINSLSTAAPAETDLQEGDEGIGTPIPPNWRPTDARITACLEEATQDELDREVTTFVNKNLSGGGFSNDWNAAFSTWWIRFKDHRTKAAEKVARKAPPRIEVNTAPEALPDSIYDSALARFATGGQWSRQLGAEPGQPGCKVPLRLIEKHGIDPKTGIKITTQDGPSAAKTKETTNG
jgi:uncharacterized protein YdaU (DUF1376 family)